MPFNCIWYCIGCHFLLYSFQKGVWPVRIVDQRRYENLVYDYSCEDHTDTSKLKMHVHSDMEIYYLVRGNVEYHIENSIYQPNPGDMLIMRSGEVHTSCVKDSSIYERYNLRVAPELLKENLNSRFLLPFTDRPLGIFNHYRAEEFDSEYVHKCFQRMFAVKDSGRTRTVSYLLPILQEVYDVWRTRGNPQENAPVSLPARIIAYINQHLAELQSPQQLSEVFFMSQSQLYRVFREYTGSSIWDYVRAKRLVAARELIQNGTSPGKAAAEYGYSDYSTFYRSYLRQFGRSPQADYTPKKSQ